MTLVPNASFIVLLAASVLCGLVSLLLWRRRRIPGGGTLALLMSAVSGWALVAAFEAGASAVATKVLLSKLEYIGSGSSALLLLVFALKHAEKTRWLALPRGILLAVIPIVNLALVFTNDWHRQLWTGFSEGPAGTNQIIYHHGPLFFTAVSGLYALILAATIVLIRTALKRSAAHRRQALAILIASVAPWIGTILYLLDLDPFAGFNVIPMSFAVSGLALSFSIVGLRHFDVVPIARSALVENMSDAVLVLDTEGAIADANRAAEELLATEGRLIGRSADDILSRWPTVLRHCRTDEPIQGEALLGEDPLRYVDVRVTPLRHGRGAVYGRALVLRDITLRYRAERGLQRANEQLREQLEEIERLQEKLRDQAIRDALTQLFNRRYLQETLPREIAQSAREGTPLSLLLLDVDRLKELNDTAGHPAGDALLQSIGGSYRR